MNSRFLFLIVLELALSRVLLQWPKIGYPSGVAFPSAPDVLGKLVKSPFMFI
jgi:hypothetical protein